MKALPPKLPNQHPKKSGQLTPPTEAATIPLAAMTAALGLFLRLRLPQPWSPPPANETHHAIPLIIYGASSAVGFFALQLSLRSNIHPLICVAGRAREYIEPFLNPSLGDSIIDYRQPDANIVAALRSAAGGRPVHHALDAVAEKGSPEILGEVLEKDGKSQATFVLFGKMGVPDEIAQSTTMVGSVHDDAKDFGHVYYRYMARGLREGWFRGQRTEVVPGGLGGVEKALTDLKEGKASAVKYVFRIAETEGVERD